MERPTPHVSETAPSFSPQPPQPPRAPESIEERGELRSTVLPPMPALKRLGPDTPPMPQTSTFHEPGTDQEVEPPLSGQPETTPSESERASQNPIYRRSKAVYAGVAAVLLLGAGMGKKFFGGQENPSTQPTDSGQNQLPSLALANGETPEKGANPSEENQHQNAIEIPQIEVPRVPLSDLEKAMQGQGSEGELSYLLQKARTQRLSEGEISRLRTLREEAIVQIRAQQKEHIDEGKAQLEGAIQIVRNQLEENIRQMRLQLERSIEDQRRRMEVTTAQNRAEMEKRIEEIRRGIEETISRSRQQ